MAKSLELARSTMVDRMLDNGIKVRSACCFGYSSEVAAALYEGQTRTVIALFDLRSQGVSLRRSAGLRDRSLGAGADLRRRRPRGGGRFRDLPTSSARPRSASPNCWATASPPPGDSDFPRR